MSASRNLRSLARLHHQSASVAGPSSAPWQQVLPRATQSRLTSTSASSSGTASGSEFPPTARGIADLSPLSSAAIVEAGTSATVEEPRVVESHEQALSLLRAQPVHYVVASLVGKTLLLHSRDLFSLPRINDVEVGDVLELDRIHEVGSRDYTLRAQDSMSTRNRGAAALTRRSVPTSNVPQNVNLPITVDSLPESDSWAARLRPSGLAHVGATLDKNIVRVRCTVVEHTKGPMEFIVKKKRRKGYKRTIRHKQTYTRLRVEAIQIGEGK